MSESSPIFKQTTLAHDVSIIGTGLHSGAEVTLVLKPAEADQGILFVRSDMPAGTNEIPALWDRVVDTRLCTVIANSSGASVGTIEHLMAALRGLNIDNLTIEVNAPEVPILDGSSQPFIDAIEPVGVTNLEVPRRTIKVLKPVMVSDGDKLVQLSPASIPQFSGEIDFDHPLIGRQSYDMTLANGDFSHHLADCRTFGFERDVEAMRAAGLARGGSLDNAIVLSDTGVLNPTGLRHKDEFIRHKLLDAVGDLYLAGAQIEGNYHGVKPGHEMNNKLLHALFADSSAWAFEPPHSEKKTADLI